MRNNFCFCLYIMLIFFITSCSVQQKIAKQSKPLLIDKIDLTTGQVGICVYDATANKYLYNYQSNKYFIPASNTKIFTCYAAMKYLGDSLIAARINETGNTITLIPAGDPTFLHEDFPNSNLLDYLTKLDNTKTIIINDNNFQDEAYGAGWSWDDYNDDYMAERSALPVYGNLITFKGTKNNYSYFPQLKANITTDSSFPADAKLGKVKRGLADNNYLLTFSMGKDSAYTVPFHTAKGEANVQLLQSLLKAKLVTQHAPVSNTALQFRVIKSQATDSLLRIMMHRSDNFFAEQSLLMVSNEKAGSMNDELIIETLLQTDLSDLPQRPQWVDGSGLSRYNLFTPQDFVFILNKMRNEFSWQRITTIFPSPGSGTLSRFGAQYANSIYAKTGSLSNNNALSGYVITKKGKTLIFSILAGNHTANVSELRKSEEQFLIYLINNF